MPFGLRRWLPVVAAALFAMAPVAYAEPQEDYDAGYKLYDEGDVVGAMPPLRKAAAAGHLKAMVLLAAILDRSEFDDEAIALYRQAADKGDPDGMFGLGTMIAAGEGAEKNVQEAKVWILKAAELGQSQAIMSLANAYLKAQMGFTEADRDSSEALRWVEAAAKGGYLPAVDALAEGYRNGAMLGLSADPGKAAEYLAQANKIRGIDPSKKKKKKL